MYLPTYLQQAIRGLQRPHQQPEHQQTYMYVHFIAKNVTMTVSLLGMLV